MTYTIQKLAKIAGISTRTLHYYDEVGLLKPSFVAENGYRHYEEKELIRLQQILFFKELGFSLRKVKEILDSPKFNLLEALGDQEKQLLIERVRIEKLVETINKTMRKVKGEKEMQDEELYDSFSKKKLEEYQKEAKERWGNTDAYRQSSERVKGWSKEDFKRIGDETDEILKNLVKVINKGVESPEVQELVERHFQNICHFYDCTLEIYQGLAQMYVQDDRFTQFYRKYHPDLPQFLSQAMLYYCDHKKSA